MPGSPSDAPLRPTGQAAEPAVRLAFFGMVLCGLTLGLGAFGAAVLLTASAPDLAALDAIFPFYHWHPVAWPVAQVRAAGGLLAALAGGAGLAGAGLARRPGGQLEWQALKAEYRRTPTGFRAAWAALSPAQRRAAGATLLALTALRLALSWPGLTPPYDDAASYTLFVSRGVLAVAGYYPLPNNHVLENLLAWLFFQVDAGFWWSVRLPALLGATAATGLWYAGWLREKLTPTAALLAVLLASLSQLGLYHAATGRGYWLVTGAAALVFFATLTLSRNQAASRRAWLAWIVGSVAGLWAVPTFALVLGSAIGWLGLRSARARSWASLRRLALATAVVGLGAALAYAPLLLLSGPAQLLGNGFVAARPWGQILRGAPAYWWETEGFLAGQMRLGALLTVLVLAGAARQLWRLRAVVPRKLPDAIPVAAWRRVGGPALWFMLAPHVLMLAQRVQAPGRTLFYKSFFLFALVALLGQQAWAWGHGGRRRLRRGLLGLAGTAWLAYQLGCHARDNRAPLRNNQAFRAAAAWLSTQPPGAALVPEPTHNIYLGLYMRSEHPAWPWHPAASPQGQARYRYVVYFPNRRGYFQPRLAGAPAFANSEVAIYVLNPTAPGSPSPAQYWYLVN